jgi:hypothetical protein
MDSHKFNELPTIANVDGMKYYTKNSTPLEWALDEGKKSFVKLLIEKGIRMTRETLSHPTLKEMISENRSILLSIASNMTKYWSSYDGHGEILLKFICNFIERGDFKNLNYILENVPMKLTNMNHILFIKCLEKEEFKTFIFLLENTYSFSNSDQVSTISKVLITLNREDLLESLIEKGGIEKLNCETESYFLENEKNIPLYPEELSEVQQKVEEKSEVWHFGDDFEVNKLEEKSEVYNFEEEPDEDF